MLLTSSGSTLGEQSSNDYIIDALIRSNHYAEAYVLLKAAPAQQLSTQYNLALCHHWVENYREALMCLDKAQMLLPAGSSKSTLQVDGILKAILEKQNTLDNYLQPVTKLLINLTGNLVAHNIIRLKSDCWLQLKEYARVIETATPIAQYNYNNINRALTIARDNT